MNCKKILILLSSLFISSCDVIEPEQRVNPRLYRLPQPMPQPQPAYQQPSGDWQYVGKQTVMGMATVKSYVDRGTLMVIDNSIKRAWIRETLSEPSSDGILGDIMYLREYNCDSRQMRGLGIIQIQPTNFSSMRGEKYWQGIPGGIFDKEYRYICNKMQKTISKKKRR